MGYILPWCWCWYRTGTQNLHSVIFTLSRFYQHYLECFFFFFKKKSALIFPQLSTCRLERKQTDKWKKMENFALHYWHPTTFENKAKIYDKIYEAMEECGEATCNQNPNLNVQHGNQMWYWFIVRTTLYLYTWTSRHASGCRQSRFKSESKGKWTHWGNKVYVWERYRLKTSCHH